MAKTTSECWHCFCAWVKNLPWSELGVLVPHAMLYITLSLVMIFVVDGYLTDDNAKGHIMSQGKFKLQSSDVITLVAVGTMITGWVASMWSTSVVFKSGYIIWLNNKAEEDRGKNRTVEKLRWTMDRRLPIKLDSRVDYTLIRISLFLIFPVLFAHPLLQGSLSWKSSSEAAGYTHIESKSPGANLWNWRWEPRQGCRNHPVINIGTGWLAGLAWENMTANQRRDIIPTCRHVMTHNQFPVGSKIFHAIIPCITIHSISWPDPTTANNTTPGRFPSDVQRVLNNPGLLSTFPGSITFNGEQTNMAVFDPTNKTLPLPQYLAHVESFLSISTQPAYPAPFLWSGVMSVLVVINTTSYMQEGADPFGPLNDSERKYILPAGDVIPIYTSGQVYPERYIAYLQVNFTAGVVNAPSATYVRPSVIEADDVPSNKTRIVAHPWVREAVCLLSDVTNIMSQFNQTLAIPTWGNLEGYAATTIRFAYMAAWTSLQRGYEPNSTTLVVEVVEPRLQAVVSLWRVLAWLGIHVLFSASWVVSSVLHRRHEVVRKVNGPADFVRELLWDVHAEGSELVKEMITREGDVTEEGDTNTSGGLAVVTEVSTPQDEASSWGVGDDQQVITPEGNQSDEEHQEVTRSEEEKATTERVVSQGVIVPEEEATQEGVGLQT